MSKLFFNCNTMKSLVNAMDILRVGRKLSNGAKVMKFKEVSKHPDDKYLAIVLCKNDKGEYVTWLYNAYDKACHNGHYFENDELVNAIYDYHDRS